MLPTQLFSRLVGRARIKHLQLVVHIADLQSLQKAAQALGMSQPAATQALAEFESVLGGALFERHARGMRTSALGQALLPMVRNAVQQIQACANTAVALQGGTRGLVRIGAIAAAVAGWLTRALPPFAAIHPDIALDIQEVTADDIPGLIEHDRVDLLLCREPALLPVTHSFTPVVQDRFVVVARADHPLASLRSVSDKKLAACTWLTPPLTGIAPQEFAEMFVRLGDTPPTCQISSRSVLLNHALLENSDMLALAPYSLMRPLADRGLLAVLRTPAVPVAPLGMVSRRDAQSQPASALAQVLRGLGESAPS